MVTPHALNAFSSLLKRCTSLSHLNQIHAAIFRTQLHSNNSLAAKLLSLSSSLSTIQYAHLVFHCVPHPNLSLWNELIKTHVKNSLHTQALSFYAAMTATTPLKPNNFTFPFLLNSCAALLSLPRGSEIHGRIVKTGFSLYLPVKNALIDMYAKCGNLLFARLAFDEMPQRDIVSFNALLSAYARNPEYEISEACLLFDKMAERNVISWNSILMGFVRREDLEKARKVFAEMPERNVVSWTTMLVGCTKAGQLALARSIFEEMPERNLVSWTAMITGYAQNGEPSKALAIFRRMVASRIRPDEVTMTGVISSCAQLGGSELAIWVSSYVEDNAIPLNSHVLTALLDMHAKCGNVDKACELFDRMDQRDVYSYSALIAGLASHGYGKEALTVFQRMEREGVEPDDVTFVGVLNACSHAGLIDEGLQLWDRMIEIYKIAPCADHYACVVDILGRAGRLEEAHSMAKVMPNGPHAGALGALLASCKTYSNSQIAEVVAQELFELEPDNTGNYILLSSIYASSGRWCDAERVRLAMKERRMMKTPGCSWI
ncbi:putative pentatricopeptide repeat-containing protein At5g37570 [Amborella trichopoda]|uniref:putative pentatricopeptide repeat-containing protein At5g37570 n=1 Tax=Amborella trichopoda TaxID=13333 RepID=UPI0009BE701D|nr:putative pentatricopeptide repeat-containing protein At5g37570 [Amborella trichopoda]|eukprot:XP_020525791.1 putative pentatricopeptide repeat-containing protein At5g37570 [Amborella trichopoda]